MSDGANQSAETEAGGSKFKGFEPPASIVFHDVYFDPSKLPKPAGAASAVANSELKAFRGSESAKEYVQRRLADLIIDPVTGDIRYSFLCFNLIAVVWGVMLYQDNGSKLLQTPGGIGSCLLKGLMAAGAIVSLAYTMKQWRNGEAQKRLLSMKNWCSGKWMVAFIVLLVSISLGAGVYAGLLLKGKAIVNVADIAALPAPNTKVRSLLDIKKAAAQAQYDLTVAEAQKKLQDELKATKP